MSTPDFFLLRLHKMIDLRHPLAVLPTRLKWCRRTNDRLASFQAPNQA